MHLIVEKGDLLTPRGDRKLMAKCEARGQIAAKRGVPGENQPRRRVLHDFLQAGEPHVALVQIGAILSVQGKHAVCTSGK